MENEMVFCKECQTEKVRLEFRNVSSPEICKSCIQERKKKRNQVQQTRRKGSSQTVQCTLHLSPFHTGILQVLSLTSNKSQLVEHALKTLYDKAPQHQKDFILIQEKEIQKVLLAKKNIIQEE